MDGGADHEDGEPLHPPDVGQHGEAREHEREADEVATHNQEPFADMALSLLVSVWVRVRVTVTATVRAGCSPTRASLSFAWPISRSESLPARSEPTSPPSSRPETRAAACEKSVKPVRWSDPGSDSVETGARGVRLRLRARWGLRIKVRVRVGLGIGYPCPRSGRRPSTW